ncbi:MAG: hypothetical protein EXR72_22080 [Myxococcales bacterium]|nr:hypothetical protein [Myxococcales bacterium]
MMQVHHKIAFHGAIAKIALLCLLASPARADVRGRIALSSTFLTEESERKGAESDASNATLFYGDLRGVLEGRRLAGGVEFKGDFRLRLTGNFDEAAALIGQAQTTSRGYAGGREYDLRELWIGRRGQSVDLHAGRLILREADALTLDGVRLGWRFHPAWRATLFGGLHPSPFSRSLGDDYPSLALGFGADLAYSHPRIWGSAAVAGIWLDGPDDGGPIDGKKPAAMPGRTEPARAFLVWSNYLRAADWLSLYHDLVLDVAGAAGVQLTRADAGVHLQAGRLRIAAGYGHLSSLALELYLARLLNDRKNFLPGTVENNLIVQRTARDEGRLRLDVRLAKSTLYAEGRVRRRALIDPGDDPNFKDVAPGLAWDLTLGARSDGDLAGLRLGAAFTEITDYRAETQLVALDLGRDFWKERLSFDFAFVWAHNRDAAADPALKCDSTMSPFTLGAGCFGRRNGEVYQGGATFGLRPDRHWFLLLDYRVVVDGADGQPAILTHVAFARIEVRM